MEETLITFETAKLAKEKGFDIPCENFYVEYLDDDVVDLFNYEEQRGSGFAELYRNNKESKFSAPTQSLLQKWLREVHKIHVDIKEWELTYWYFYIKDGRTSPVKNIRIKIDEDSKWEFDSYEEALEVGLLEGLKLVKDELV